MKKKRINSIVNITNDICKLKVGTMDKKNPTVLYLIGGIYIKPKKEKDDYHEDIATIKNDLSKSIKTEFYNNPFYKKDYMFFSDIAEDRISFNKKSFFTFQIYVKPKEEMLEKTKTFKEITDIMPKMNFVTTVKNIIENIDFIVSKVK